MIVENYALNNDYKDILSSLSPVLEYARQNFIPVVLDDTAKLLIDTLMQTKPSRILEIGTAIGYSGLIMLKSVPNALLTTIEIDKDNFLLAKQNFEFFNKSKQVNQILGNAMFELENLIKSNQKFDFVFLDGPKAQYPKYLPMILKLLTKNGIIFADDVLFLNEVEGEKKVKHKHRTMIMGLRKYLQLVLNDNLFETKVYRIGEGVAITTTKSKGENYEQN